jgi:hypothetical protein
MPLSEVLDVTKIVQDDSNLLSGFPWPINGNPDNNLESPCKIWNEACLYRIYYGVFAQSKNYGARETAVAR